MIAYIELAGYKSISSPQRMNISGLTVLAGANSSGKSAIMQPILLWKQTVECSYDPGALLLDGPNIKITAGNQILSKIRNKELGLPGSFMVSVGVQGDDIRLIYRRNKGGSFKIESQKVSRENSGLMTLIDGQAVKDEDMRSFTARIGSPVPVDIVGSLINGGFAFRAKRDRCFLTIEPFMRDAARPQRTFGMSLEIVAELSSSIKRLIHVPGLRGNPERTYRATEVSNQFPGTYENYVASIITMWQESGSEKLGLLGDQLRSLGLTWKVSAKKIEDTRVELRVGRMPQATRGGASDLVNIADVGLGVAQVLPILVAMLSASKNQIVYIEQPELHLHPKAQWKLAEIVRDAVNRGVKVVIETHSSVFLRGIQTEIALSNLKASDVSFNWFTRNIDGNTVISACVPDEKGAFGNWPADFDDVTLQSEDRYLDALSGDFR